MCPMRLLHKVSLAALSALLAFADLPAAKRKVSEAEVHRVHCSTLLIDTHNDVTSMTVEGFDIGSTGSKHHTDLARLKAGGVGAVFFAAYVGPEYVARQNLGHPSFAHDRHHPDGYGRPISQRLRPGA
ncbi:MAG: hypothetical protein EXQ58_13475 [Acidobacteria bacterium]|nr:hypothetical protein [Acidobacteriota bacterium]